MQMRLHDCKKDAPRFFDEPLVDFNKVQTVSAKIGCKTNAMNICHSVLATLKNALTTDM